MPYYAKSEDWLKQSSLLIEARPATTRVTTTYTVKPSRKEEDATESKPKKSYGHLILKTYDPASGTCLKYKTSKAAEVSRLIQMLGTLGKKMAGVPESSSAGAGAEDVKDEVMVDAPPVAAAGVAGGEAERGSGASTPAPAAGQTSGAGGGAKGKKKKGKR